jgi:hypothetical protein
LRATGYVAAVTTEPQGAKQSADEIFELQRIRVRGSHSVNDFGYWIKYFTTNGK